MSIQTSAQSAPVATKKTPVHDRNAQVDARAIHDRLHRALITLHEAECNAVTIFAEILRRRLYRDLGYATIHIYAGEALGFSRTKTYEFILLAEALDKLPALEAGIRAGKVPWTKAREVVKVATPKNEKRWLKIAEQSSRRELERQVLRSKAVRDGRKRDPGQGEMLMKQPETEPPAAPPAQTVTLRLDPLKRARFDAMVEKLMKRHRRSWDEIILMALELMLGGGEISPSSAKLKSAADSDQVVRSAQPEKSSRVDCGTPYQVVVYRCETCASTAVRPERKPLSTAEMGQVECDSKILEPGRRNRSSIPPSRRKEVMLRDGHRCRVQGCGSTHFLEVHHLKPRSAGGSNEESNLVVICSTCHGHLHQRGGVAPPLRDP